MKQAAVAGPVIAEKLLMFVNITEVINENIVISVIFAMLVAWFIWLYKTHIIHFAGSS